MKNYRIPFDAHLDLTYRCNHNCVHCWLRLGVHDEAQAGELDFSEIRRIVDEARLLGVRNWSISGGEPLLRPDFPEIFEYITSRCISYSLNTNGTLITPEISRLLTAKGSKMVALYGATRETYETVTRNPDGFEQLMQGLRYLQEAGAGFIVQLIPMKANRHEWNRMIELAESLSPHWRVGASWLHLSSCRDEAVNARIAAQRLDPGDIVNFDPPDMSSSDSPASCCGQPAADGRLFAACIATRRDFHIDPYGGMSFCSFLKDPEMRYDLRKGRVEEGWETFIPSLAERVFDINEYMANCGSCEAKADCQWCAVHGWLEHGRYTAPVEYLCGIARENSRYREAWKHNHRRYFRIAGITIELTSDLPIVENTFQPRFDSFAVDEPGTDVVTIRHHFGIPDLNGMDLGKELYRKAPWAIYQKKSSYIYLLGVTPWPADLSVLQLASCGMDHGNTSIFNNEDYEAVWRKGNLHALTMFPTDQLLITRLLADRQGFALHAAGAIVNGTGMLFVGHSEAGKSTTTNFLIEAGRSGQLEVEILCDDRNIVRRQPEGWTVYGTWSHGDVPLVSSSGALLTAICFIEKADVNQIEPLTEYGEITRRLLACLIRPFVTADWWEKTLDHVAMIVGNVPFYRMRFDKSGKIVEEIARIANG